MNNNTHTAVVGVIVPALLQKGASSEVISGTASIFNRLGTFSTATPGFYCGTPRDAQGTAWVDELKKGLPQGSQLYIIPMDAERLRDYKMYLPDSVSHILSQQVAA